MSVLHDNPCLDVTSMKAVAIGISTGGPKILRQILVGLPADLSVPIFIAQHIPPTFSKTLAASLDLLSPLTVVEAEDGMPVFPGTVYLGKGRQHLRVRKGSQLGSARIEVNKKPDGLFYYPSADELLRSCSEVYHGKVLGIVMTGIGKDGTLGAETIKSMGGLIASQDEASCSVYGMPRSVEESGLSDAVLTPDEMTQLLMQFSSSYPPPCLKR
ncbi:Chemotaxis response regulator protein-glutamate methylesterase [Poriferisphaera corsica]|uniref:protein-glutamate methylesterase n=1 Tax=Poriferisphaera corsica TaxID=2528020 RepID=A0A517YWP0_9BACT|nr:CheB methylesterase domain-containing protein [Poriferisphaera corsica]QDU34630.1 Chemotaxis response regulator protein-glutamate methylesterase [Poriferisphaera corsica]